MMTMIMLYAREMVLGDSEVITEEGEESLNSVENDAKNEVHVEQVHRIISSLQLPRKKQASGRTTSTQIR